MVLFKVFTNAPAKYHAYTTYGFVEPGTATLVEFFVDGTTDIDESQDDGANSSDPAILSTATLPPPTKPRL